MIIGVSGYVEDTIGKVGSAGAGKDTVADILVAYHGFVKVALADEIKRIAARLWGFSAQSLWGPSELRNIQDERYPLKRPMRVEFNGDTEGLNDYRVHLDAYEACPFLTPRRALQQIGTEVARSIDPDVWIRFAIANANKLLGGASYTQEHGIQKGISMPCSGVVISDVRFPNEVKGIEKVGGKNWRKKRWVKTLTGAASKHASEISLLDTPDDSFDAVLPDGSLAHLQLLIGSVLSVYAGKLRPYDDMDRDVPPFRR